MKASAFLSVRVLVALVFSVMLAGCGAGNVAINVAGPLASQMQIGAVRGSNFGGHAPLVGAHIYLLQASNTYGGQATSILNTGASPTGLTRNASDPGVPAGWYYNTTDQYGVFDLTGDYTCTSGLPVWIYGYGGSPSFAGAGPNTFSVATEELYNNGTGVYLTYATTAAQLFYVGESVTVAGNMGGAGRFNQTGAVVASGYHYNGSAAGLSTSSFTIYVPYNGSTLVAGTASAAPASVTGTVTVTGTPTFNPGVVNLAMLGVCPSSGNFATGGTLPNGQTFSPLNFIFMNEVSTAAMAIAMEGFVNQSATSGFATYLGAPASNLIGLQNSAYNAGQVYDLVGSDQSTTYAGEGHIARLLTPAKNGNVPQATLDTLGNILAACVDSNNTSTGNNSAGESAQCKVLFQTATSNGIPFGNTGAGTVPVDTAQAAFNIAMNPAGDPAYTGTFMTSLYTLPTGQVPFTPQLTAQPNDFTVAIQYPNSLNSTINGPESIAIDANGYAWFDTLPVGNQYVFSMTPQGTLGYKGPAAAGQLAYLSIDPAGNIWLGCAFRNCQESKYTVTTSAMYNETVTGPTAVGPTAYDSYATVVGGNGNVYFGGTTTTGTTCPLAATWCTFGMSNAGAALSGFPYSSLLPQYYIAHGAIENSSTNGAGAIWWTTETNTAILRVNASTGAAYPGFPLYQTGTVGVTYTGNISSPKAAAVDASGNLWAGNNSGAYGNTLSKISPTGAVTAATGGTLNTPFGVAVDGGGRVFVANRGSTGAGANSIAVYSATTAKNLSPSTNYTLAGLLSQPLNITVDQSGTLWIAAFDSNMVVQWLGAGAPSAKPYSAASAQNKIGARP